MAKDGAPISGARCRARNERRYYDKLGEKTTKGKGKGVVVVVVP